MSTYRIFYLRGGLLEAADEVASDDLLGAAKAASSVHPELTAEIWCEDRKVAIVRPSMQQRLNKSELRLGNGVRGQQATMSKYRVSPARKPERD